eukprot:CAMPEP_0182570768 /NCGR_PEP_ID=MMETSP1324-20130603/10980_1 /TAXON_ID=236786 /ORGANISM="Florenciella sp., Strain RCC1587" /LENGTH=144 /DNA_ID=CAMNT_0024785197 /DNA_START=132 /DNA_END=566 /DNA_ORIENTATION=+
MAVSATDNTTVGSWPDTCFTDQNDCMDACRDPDYGAQCDSEVQGVNIKWCCHNPSAGCFSNYDDTYAHCSSKSVKKMDDYYYCCTQSDCCYSSDGSDDCNVGDTCCNADCDDPLTCSYTESGCSGTYGAKHNCMWDTDHCIVGL